MIRYITEDEVGELFDVATAIELLDAASRKLASGEAAVAPRQRVRSGNVMMHMLGAALDGRVGHKTYTVAPPKRPRFWVTLFGTDGTMVAMIEADKLGQIRTGAASGLATRLLALPQASVTAIIGTGWQARTQLEAVCLVRPIERAYAYGRDAARLQAFCAEMSARLGLPVEAAPDVASAVAGAQIVSTMTNATEPVLSGAWLAPGTHVNAAGSNRANAAEVDPDLVRSAAVVAVENVAQAKVEAGDLLGAERAGAFTWDRAVLLSDLVAGTAPGRGYDDDITLFESLGIGLWDLAAASHIYDLAVERGFGREVDLPV